MITRWPEMSPRRPQETKNEPRRRQEPKTVKIRRFLTPPSAPRHDSTKLLGVRFEIKLEKTTLRIRILQGFTFEKRASLGLARF